MSRAEDFKNGMLREFINPDEIEKAPEGFTSKVMSHVYMQPKPVRKERRRILAIYSGAILSLASGSLLMPQARLKFPEITMPANLNIRFPDLIQGSPMPHILLYIVAGAVMLVVLDSALKRLFHRSRNS